MGSWKFETTKDLMEVYVEGVFSPEDGMKYYQDFQNESAKVNPATCQLNLSATKLAVSASDAAPVLTSILDMYKKFGYENVTMDLGTNAILKMQVKSLASKVGFTNFKIK